MSYFDNDREENSNYCIKTYTDEEIIHENHFHSDVELVFVLKGSMLVNVEERIYVLKENDICLILPFEKHEFNVDGFCTCYRLYIPEFLVRSFIIQINNKCLESSVMTPNENTHKIKRYLERLTLSNHTLIEKANLYAILGSILECIPLEEKKYINHDAKVINQVLNYISCHYTENITLNNIATDLGINVGKVSSIFNNTFKCGFKKYINSLRVNRANYLFSQGQKYILDVALNSGFSSVRTFNRVYKELLGTSPREYIKTHFDSDASFCFGDELEVANVQIHIKDKQKTEVLWQWIKRKPVGSGYICEMIDTDEKIVGVPSGYAVTIIDNMSDLAFYRDIGHDVLIDLTKVVESSYLTFFIRIPKCENNINLKVIVGSDCWETYLDKIIQIKKSKEWQKITIKLSDMHSVKGFEWSKMSFVWFKLSR